MNNAKKEITICVAKDENEDGEEDVQKPGHILADEKISSHARVPESDVKPRNREIILFLTFSTTYIIIMLSIFNIPLHSEIDESIIKEFSGYNYQFSQVKNKYRFFKWAEELIGYCYQTYYYDGRDKERNNSADIAFSNYFVSRKINSEKG